MSALDRKILLRYGSEMYVIVCVCIFVFNLYVCLNQRTEIFPTSVHSSHVALSQYSSRHRHVKLEVVNWKPFKSTYIFLFQSNLIILQFSSKLEAIETDLHIGPVKQKRNQTQISINERFKKSWKRKCVARETTYFDFSF